MDDDAIEQANLEIARRWCAGQGPGWSVENTAGRGGTAPVFTINTPDGPLALKLYDAEFSQGELGQESERRLKPQLDLGLHDCEYLVRVHSGGRFEDRLFVLMDKAPGHELEKRLADVPRDKIRLVLDQLAQACIFLRETGHSHRDIKSANIFITDDFNKITLLDLSVMRDVHDPIGLGTDHGNKLPVVATSRYSPPEYLFRLFPAGPDLWHALDIYQLGGVLHDLIMREPMFQQEYLLNRDTNRYRFAWIVATQAPVVQAADVDADLILLAKRALDKDWQRRSQLRLEDFLDDAATRRTSGLEVLGLDARRRTTSSHRPALQKRMAQLCEAVETEIVTGLRAAGITAEHQSHRGLTDEGRTICFRWDPPSVGAEAPLSRVELAVALQRTGTANGPQVNITATLSGTRGGELKKVSIELPSVDDTEKDGLEAEISSAVLEVLGELGTRIMRVA